MKYRCLFFVHSSWYHTVLVYTIARQKSKYQGICEHSRCWRGCFRFESVKGHIPSERKQNAPRIEHGKQKRAYRISRTIWKYNYDKGLSEIREREKERKIEKEREGRRGQDRMEGGTKQPSAGVRTAFKVFYFERDVRGWETKGVGWRIKESRGDSTRRAEDLFIFLYFSLYFFPSSERDASISVAFQSPLCLCHLLKIPFRHCSSFGIPLDFFLAFDVLRVNASFEDRKTVKRTEEERKPRR